MSLKVYNSISKRKEEFHPNTEGLVNMYVCGITPYDRPHIGHARCYVVFDVVHRYLEHIGNKVKYVQNFTDIDDKIIKKSNESKMPVDEIVKINIEVFKNNMKSLNVLDADFYPRVTAHIKDIIKHIEGLIKKELAYEAGGDVYFSVRRFKDYGKLSGRSIEDLQAVSRVDNEPHKKDPFDFALWKRSKPKEPAWDSPWGKGRPGWHIECSAMSAKYLGPEIDIHGGGQDLIFPHHENEIAQSEGYTDKNFVKYWLHNGFISINKEKMSKSLGNITSIDDVLDKYPPMGVRLFILSQHYRSGIDFSFDLVEQSVKSYERIKQSLADIKFYLESGKVKCAEDDKETVDKIFYELDDFYNSMDDDFNTAKAAANLNNAISLVNAGMKKLSINTLHLILKKLIERFSVIGIVFDFSPSKLDEEVSKLIEQRQSARKNKNWVESDRIRNLLSEKGIILEDTQHGVRWKKK